LIFQPCKTKEVITILHLHLKNPIMVGNKKTKVCLGDTVLARSTSNIDRCCGVCVAEDPCRMSNSSAKSWTIPPTKPVRLRVAPSWVVRLL